MHFFFNKIFNNYIMPNVCLLDAEDEEARGAGDTYIHHIYPNRHIRLTFGQMNSEKQFTCIILNP